MASANLARTPSSAGSTTTGTFSFWIKGNLATGSNQNLYSVSDGTNTWQMWINVNGQLDFHAYNGSSYVARIHPGRKLKDVNAWYHIVCTIDTTNATAGDRLRLYINGERYTGPWTAEVQPTQNLSVIFCKNSTTRIGSEWNNSDYFEGNMAHFHLIDGTAYDASAFGESDSNGVWKPKTAPSVTYGTNGFFLKFDNSGNMGLDSSGQSNNWTTSGTIIQNKDTPSNVFCTMNPLDNYWQGAHFSYGNNKVITGDSSQTFSTSTLMMTSGKFYAEVKLAGSATCDIGITGQRTDNSSDSLISRPSGWGYRDSGSVSNNGSSVGGTWSSYANGDIIGIAINLDNEQDGLNKLYFSKNGVWQNGADPSTPSSTTGVVGITKPSNLSGTNSLGAYSFSMSETWNDNSRTFEWNFGNGYFGTTAVTSAGTNASGNGIFEYDVPTGYTALSTKGLDS